MVGGESIAVIMNALRREVERRVQRASRQPQPSAMKIATHGHKCGSLGVERGVHPRTHVRCFAGTDET